MPRADLPSSFLRDMVRIYKEVEQSRLQPAGNSARRGGPAQHHKEGTATVSMPPPHWEVEGAQSISPQPPAHLLPSILERGRTEAERQQPEWRRAPFSHSGKARMPPFREGLGLEEQDPHASGVGQAHSSTTGTLGGEPG